MSDIKTVPALALADALPTIVFGELAQGILNAAAAELRRQHALIAQMQREAVQPESRCMYPACNCFSPQGPQSCAHPAPHPEAQALDSQLQQPDADSTRASGVCASMTLLPCPFCGGEAITGEFDVECDNPFCEVQPSACGQSLTEAVAGWNRRSTAGAQQQDDHAGSPAPSEPVAVVGSDFQLLYCRMDWSKGLRVGDKLYNHPAPSAQSSKAALSDDEREALEKIESLLTNMQPHIEQACKPGHAQFIDNYVGPALEIARAGIGESRREPLTEAETDEKLRAAGIRMQYMTHAITRKELWTTAGSVDVMSIVRAIEAAHGITPQAGKESGE